MSIKVDDKLNLRVGFDFRYWLMLKKSWNIQTPPEFLVDNDSYIIEGRKYYRVTRVKSVINQPGLNYWRAKMGLKKSKEIMVKRGTFGTNFHKLIEVILTGHNVDASNYGEEMQTSLDLFIKAKEKYNIRAEALEQKLWNDDLGVAGTTDFIGYADLPKLGKKAHVIFDWKTSTAIYPDFFLQLAAYVFTFEKMTGIKLDGAVVLQIRDGKIKIEEKSYEELKKFYQVFKCALCIFKYQKKEHDFWESMR